MSLDDPEIVRAEYATEDGLEERRSIYESAEGEDAREVAFRAIATGLLRRVLESDRVPDDVGPAPAGTRVTVFVAQRA